MSDQQVEPEFSVDLPGTPVAEFSVAVSVFEQLRNEGSFSLFVGRENSVRVLGEVQEFAGRVRKTLPQFSQPLAEIALEEIRQFVQLLLSGIPPEKAALMLVDSPYSNFQSENEVDKAAQRDHLRRKIELSQRLINRGLEDRSNRLASTLSAVLEDVDIEIVSQRHSQVDNRIVKSPFLRLGIRYSKPKWILFGITLHCPSPAQTSNSLKSNVMQLISIC